MKHIVCYSGGHTSAICAIEVVRRFSKNDVVLLNHDMHFSVEDADIKRFKREVSEYALGAQKQKENDAKICERDFKLLKDTEEAHYRHASIPFNPINFGFDMNSIYRTKACADAIRSSKE